MKLLLDLFPLLLFFGVYRLAKMFEDTSFAIASTYLSAFVAGGKIEPDQAPIMIATLVAIIATTLQLLYIKLRGRKIDGMLWISFLIITVFGGATIYFHDDTFIKWKPTIIYWVFAVAMCVAQFGFGKNLMRQAMEAQIKLPEPVWKNVGLAWIACFLALGVINLLAAFVVYKGDTSAWVTFKLFGMNGLLFAFIIVQTLMLSKYIEAEEQA